jgi:hypothetical protein
VDPGLFVLEQAFFLVRNSFENKKSLSFGQQKILKSQKTKEKNHLIIVFPSLKPVF